MKNSIKSVNRFKIDAGTIARLSRDCQTANVNQSPFGQTKKQSNRLSISFLSERSKTHVPPHLHWGSLLQCPGKEKRKFSSSLQRPQRWEPSTPFHERLFEANSNCYSATSLIQPSLLKHKSRTCAPSSNTFKSRYGAETYRALFGSQGKLQQRLEGRLCILWMPGQQGNLRQPLAGEKRKMCPQLNNLSDANLVWH